MGSLSRIIQEGPTCIRTVLIKEAKGYLTPDERSHGTTEARGAMLPKAKDHVWPPEAGASKNVPPSAP